MLTKSQYDHLIRMYRAGNGNKPQDWVGKKTWKQFVDHLRNPNNATSNRYIKMAQEGRLKPGDHLPTPLRKAYKPPQVVDDYEEVKEKLYRRKK